MPWNSADRQRCRELRLQVERGGGLPIRPASARAALAEALAQDEPRHQAHSPKRHPPLPCAHVDPGWTLAALSGESDPLRIVEGRPWWPSRPSREGHEARERLWRHAVATSRAAERLAIEAGYPDPAHLGRLALLVPLGLWAVAMISPENLAGLLAIGDPERRRAAERSLLGTDAAAFGRDLAEVWGLPDLLADAAWLHADPSDEFSATSDDPLGLDLLQRARAWAEATPWALDRPDEPSSAAREHWISRGDERAKRLVAEVQSLCAGGLQVADATTHEERLARSHAGLIRRHRRLRRDCEARDRTFRLMSDADPSRHVASDAEPADDVDIAQAGPSAREALAAWESNRRRLDRLAGRLDVITEAYRQRARRDDEVGRAERLEALAEFAAGAAHELNNPLAVIMGRAQLLMTHRGDEERSRSLRAIVGQAQRAHRILRDLMYVARPAEPRPRPCQPDAIARSCLDDLRAEAEAREVRLVVRVGEPFVAATADPDGLRHLAEALLRNALEASSPGGIVTLIARSRPDRLDWTIRDRGRGLDPQASRHLLDPFYCGREAGRGLGLGLARAARYVQLAGGRLRWRSVPGQGTTFRVTMPMPEILPRASAPEGGQATQGNPGDEPFGRSVSLAG